MTAGTKRVFVRDLLPEAGGATDGEYEIMLIKSTVKELPLHSTPFIDSHKILCRWSGLLFHNRLRLSSYFSQGLFP